MQNLALKLIDEELEKGIDPSQNNAVEVSLIESAEQDIYVFFCGNLFAQYQKREIGRAHV